MANIIHYSARTQSSWVEKFDGSKVEALRHVRAMYGKAPRVERYGAAWIFRFVGFYLMVE